MKTAWTPGVAEGASPAKVVVMHRQVPLPDPFEHASFNRAGGNSSRTLIDVHTDKGATLHIVSSEGRKH